MRRVNPTDCLDDLESWMTAVVPQGMTDMASVLGQVRKSVEACAPDLQKQQKQAFVIIVTDGEPTPRYWAQGDRDVQSAEAKSLMVHELQRLSGELPTSLVVRLCTDEDATVEFWSNLDDEEEFSLDVLDDMEGEAKEVCQGNPWLTYGASLHTYREAGSTLRLFDLLDECKFNKAQQMAFVRLIVGNEFAEQALAGRAAGGDIPQELMTWCPLTKKPQPWIQVGKGDKECVIC